MRTLILFCDATDLSFGSTGVSNRTPLGFGVGAAGLGVGAGLEAIEALILRKLLRPPNQLKVSSSRRRSSWKTSGNVCTSVLVLPPDWRILMPISEPSERKTSLTDVLIGLPLSKEIISPFAYPNRNFCKSILVRTAGCIVNLPLVTGAAATSVGEIEIA